MLELRQIFTVIWPFSQRNGQIVEQDRTEGLIEWSKRKKTSQAVCFVKLFVIIIKNLNFTKNLPNVILKDHYNSKLTWSEHLECRWRGSVQRSSPQNTGRVEKATKVRLEKCDLRLYTLTKLAHSLPRRLEKVTKKGGHPLVTNISFNQYKMNKE